MLNLFVKMFDDTIILVRGTSSNNVFECLCLSCVIDRLIQETQKIGRISRTSKVVGRRTNQGGLSEESLASYAHIKWQTGV